MISWDEVKVFDCCGEAAAIVTTGHDIERKTTKARIQCNGITRENMYEHPKHVQGRVLYLKVMSHAIRLGCNTNCG